MKEYISIKNNHSIPAEFIPILSYEEFHRLNLELMLESTARHCANYFGYPISDGIRLICCIADDLNGEIYISAANVKREDDLQSMTVSNHNFERFEREISENFSIKFIGHPWPKPVRYSHNRSDKQLSIENYPFLKSKAEELHEVGVGPIHAGVIEPGHFRFICNGEQIMHLEIQLGFQHRGIEQLFLTKKKLLEKTILAENIAGDTTVGHTTAFANLWESLCGFQSSYALDFNKTIALELERIAIHTGDIAAICADIAYQLGNSVFGRLRTPIVNFFQEWNGNRLAKGLIRAGRTNCPFTDELGSRLLKILRDYEPDFEEITKKLSLLPSALSRMEKTGVVTYDQVREIGTVGMSARMSGLNRDIRASHPFNLYGKQFEHTPVMKHHGDVYSRFQIRKEEIRQSIEYIKLLLANLPKYNNSEPILNPSPSTFTISLVEGWRGEICHCAITDERGELIIYKIKDPSFHNWMALAQAVRNNDISDFPVCNKSFNLSYCGHDL